MTPLIVRAPWAAQAAWVGTRVQGRDGSDSSLKSWSQAQDIPTSQELILAVPAQLLSWHSVALPKLAASRWRAVLDTLLEERLLSEPSEVHMALAPSAQAGQEVMVAACDKAWLSQTLQTLERAGHRISRIVPEFEPGPHRLHLQGHTEQGWLIDCAPGQVQCLPLFNPVQAGLQTWRATLHPAGTLVTAEPALVAAADNLGPQSPQLLTAPQALQQAATSAWNLAQFDLASRSAWHQRLGRRLSHGFSEAAWRPVRWGVATLLLLQALGLQAWAWKENRDLEQREQALRDVLTRTFPQVKLVIDPLLQMERETTALAQGSALAGTADMSRMLAALSTVAGSVAKAMEYRPGELVLIGWQAPAGSDWKASLARQGLRMEPQGDRWLMRPTQDPTP